MCGRYTVLTEQEIIEIREILQDISLRIVRDEFEDYTEKPGEIRPTDRAPVITLNKDGISFENLKWGFKKWSGSGVIINARAESVKTKDMFINHLASGRCVVPASDFYEWQNTTNVKRKHYAKDKFGNLLFMAGLYRDTDDGREFVIITKESSGEMAKIHDRVPVILRTYEIESWLNGKLDPDDLAALDYDLSVVACDDEGVTQLSLWDE